MKRGFKFGTKQNRIIRYNWDRNIRTTQSTENFLRTKSISFWNDSDFPIGYGSEYLVETMFEIWLRTRQNTHWDASEHPILFKSEYPIECNTVWLNVLGTTGISGGLELGISEQEGKGTATHCYSRATANHGERRRGKGSIRWRAHPERVQVLGDDGDGRERRESTATTAEVVGEERLVRDNVGNHSSIPSARTQRRTRRSFRRPSICSALPRTAATRWRARASARPWRKQEERGNGEKNIGDGNGSRWGSWWRALLASGEGRGGPGMELVRHELSSSCSVATVTREKKGLLRKTPCRTFTYYN